GGANPATATQTIRVSDGTPPVISNCPADRILAANSSGKAPVPDLRGEVVASDNCNNPSGLTITQSPAAGTIIGLGAAPVTITVADPVGNSSSCISTITVSFPLKDFVVFSQEFTQLKSGAKVFSGDVRPNARF